MFSFFIISGCSFSESVRVAVIFHVEMINLLIIFMTWCPMQSRKVPEDDPRLAATKDIIARVQKRNNWVHGAQTEIPKEDGQEQEYGDNVQHSGEVDVPTEQDHIAVDGDAEEQSREHVAAAT